MSPWAPKHPCATQGCPVLLPRGQTRCGPHAQVRQRAYDAARADDPYRKFYLSPEWRRFRAAYLATHPVCGEPDCPEPSTEIDHRTPIREGGAPLDEANLTPYCKRHASSKSARRGERWGRR